MAPKPSHHLGFNGPPADPAQPPSPSGLKTTMFLKNALEIRQKKIHKSIGFPNFRKPSFHITAMEWLCLMIMDLILGISYFNLFHDNNI